MPDVTPPRRHARAAVAFGAAFGVTLVYALRGGSYDVVVRDEHALVAWWVLGIGWALGVLPRARLPRSAVLPAAGFLGLAALTAVSLTWTESQGATAGELARVLHHAGLALLVWSVVDRQTWLPAAAGLTGAAVLVCLMAVGARLEPGAFPDNAIERVFEHGRLSYPLAYWNALAAWGVMTVALLLGWSSHARSSGVRALTLAAVPACGLCIYLTYSRAALGGAAIAVAAVVALSHNRLLASMHALAGALGTVSAIWVARSHPEIAGPGEGAGAGQVAVALVLAGLGCAVTVWAGRRLRGDERWRLSRAAARRAAVAAAAAGAIAAAVVGPPLLSSAWESFSADERPSAQADLSSRLTTVGGNRHRLYGAALDALEAEPLTGIGPGSFEFWVSRTQPDAGHQRDAHSLYLEQLAELGPAGLALVLAACGGLLAAALRGRAGCVDVREKGVCAGLAAASLAYLFHAGLDWMWELTAVTALAIAAAVLAAASGGAQVASGSGARPARPVRAAVVAVALVGCMAQLPELVSVSQIRASQDKVRAADLPGARGAAIDAVGAEPWAAHPYVQLALVDEAGGDLTAAAAALRDAVDREPTAWRHRLLLARVEAERGRPRAALSELRRAKRLRPMSVFYPGDPGPR